MFASKTKQCKNCGGSGHTAFTCRLRTDRKRTLLAAKPMKRSKRLRPIGKVGQKLLDQRKQFLRDNDPPYYCIYCQHIGIDLPLLENEVNVEHTESKARHPELRFVQGNLAVSCSYHNRQKSSRSISEYLKILDNS